MVGRSLFAISIYQTNARVVFVNSTQLGFEVSEHFFRQPDATADGEELHEGPRELRRKELMMFVEANNNLKVEHRYYFLDNTHWF